MMVLPKVYEVNENTPEKYKVHEGKPKISYSQYTSFIEPLYFPDYIQQYFYGIKKDAGIFAEFGSACGQFMEDLSIDKNWLSDFDVEVLSSIERPDNAVYEGEIVIDRGSYVIQGFIDQEFEVAPGKLNIIDFKTGNVDKKVAFYGGDEYQQTTLYAYQREVEGWEINWSGVKLIGRKGNGREGHPLRLSGVVETIPTPYSKERAEMALKKIDVVANTISELYQVYLKM